MKAIEYAINGDKTDECRLVTGLNISTNAKDAYEEFRLNFELHTGERFYKQILPGDKTKTRVRLHHYIQSFKPDEVTPEMANEIGKMWANEFTSGSCFSTTRYQVLICTHTDRHHIHNHILISAMDFDGKVLYDNMKTLNNARALSDKIAESYGLSVIKNPKKRTDLPYTEFIAKQKKTSWKDKLRRDIDKLVLLPDVKSINDLAEKLNTMGYVTTVDKYLHVKRATDKKKNFMSTLKLGDGYGTEELQYRIDNKNVIMPLSTVNGYQGIQREYAFCLREIQFLLFRKKKSDYNVSYSTVRKSSELLYYLAEHKIQSVQDFENAVNSTDEKYRKLNDRKKQLEEKIADDEKVIALESDFNEFYNYLKNDYPMKKMDSKFKVFWDNRISSRKRLEDFKERYFKNKSEFEEINREIEKAYAERKKAADSYKTYLEQRETDYDCILHEMKENELYEFNDNGITETYNADVTDIKYFAELYKGSVTENTPVDRRKLLHAFNVKYNLPDDEPDRNYSRSRNADSWSR